MSSSAHTQVYKIYSVSAGVALKAFLEAEGLPLNHIKPQELFFCTQREAAIMDAVLRTRRLHAVCMNHGILGYM
jgi:hypothetical protein